MGDVSFEIQPESVPGGGDLRRARQEIEKARKALAARLTPVEGGAELVAQWADNRETQLVLCHDIERATRKLAKADPDSPLAAQLTAQLDRQKPELEQAARDSLELSDKLTSLLETN